MLVGLGESIDSIGMIHPIRVRRVDGGYEVVAGAHRFAACDSLGHHEIACFVVDDDDRLAELAMIDENLCRAELSPADRAKQTARRKTIYEELHPATKHGGVRTEASRQLGDLNRFSAETASVTGKSERVVQRDASRGEKIAPEALDEVRGTPLARGRYLDGLKRVELAQQVDTVRRDLEQPRPRGGIAGRYVQNTPGAAATPPDNVKLFARFIEIADGIEAMSVASLIDGAGRRRAVLRAFSDQYAS